MAVFEFVIIAAQDGMEVHTVTTDDTSANVFTKFVDDRTKAFCEDSHDDEEIDEILGEIWNSHEFVAGVHMVRTEAETIVMVVK